MAEQTTLDKVSTGAGIAGGVLGMISNIGAGKRQHKRQKELMDIQMKNQQQLNAEAYQRSLDYWDKTNYNAQVGQMEKAGLNVGLMYGGQGGGGQTMGVSAGSAAGGNASMDIPMDIGAMANLALLKAQKENIEADTENKKASANKAGAETTTIEQQREVLNENLKQIGKGMWFDNLLKEWRQNVHTDDDPVEVVKNTVYGSQGGIQQGSPEAQEFNATLLKTIAEKENLDATKILTDNKAKGYWQELLNATAHADASKIQANAIKLASEWGTGEYTNWKTWADLGMKAADMLGNIIKGGTKINSTTTNTKNYPEQTTNIYN